MKKTIIIFSLLMLAGFIGTMQAQDAVKEKPVLTAEQNQAVEEAILMDPKLSTEEIEHLKLAVLGAPAKADAISDPKEESQPEVVLAPWKAEPIEEREAVLAPPVEQQANSTLQSGTQADGGKAENVVNLHSLSIPGAIQLEAPKVETVTIEQESIPVGVNPQAVPDTN